MARCAALYFLEKHRRQPEWQRSGIAHHRALLDAGQGDPRRK
jgi:hypothetical protein